MKMPYVALVIMILVFYIMCATTAYAASLPSVEQLSTSNPSQLLAWAVVVESGIIVFLAGVVVQAYRSRINALEHQVKACRECASQIAKYMKSE